MAPTAVMHSVATPAYHSVLAITSGTSSSTRR